MKSFTLIQPTMEVVSAELYCVQSMMEYIKTKLCDTVREDYMRAAVQDVVY